MLRVRPSPHLLPRGSSLRALSALIVVALTGGCPAKPTITPEDLNATEQRPAAPEFEEPAPQANKQPSPPPQRPEPVPVHERDAVAAAIASGNHGGAIDFLKTWTLAHADDLEAAFLLAHASAARGDLDGAEAALEHATPADIKADSALLRARARLRLRRGDRTLAEILLRRAHLSAGDDLATQGELLALLRAHGDGGTSEAKALMEALYDAYDDSSAKSAEELLAVAQAALTRGTSGAFHDANMVLGEAEQAPVAGPEPELMVRDRVLLLRAQIFQEKYASADASATYEIILRRDPWHADALGGLALVLEDEFKLADASRLATMALQTNPEHPLALAALARVAVIEGRRREARQLATRATAVNPSLHQALAVLAAAAIIDGDRQSSAKIEARALADAHDGRRYAVALAELLVSMHLYPEADEILSAALLRTPDDANVNSSFGLNRLRLADENAGRAALTKAWKRDHFNERTRNVLDLYDNAIDSRYSEVKDGQSGLTLRLPSADHEWIEGGLQESYRRARAGLDRRYGIDPGELRLEVFADPNEFSIRTVGVPSLGALGVCFGPLITLIGPYQGTHNIDQVIWHELAHVYAIRLSAGRVPRWFTEGLSEWESEVENPAWARESALLLATARRQGQLRRLGELELAFLRAGSARGMEVAYASSAYALRYLGETYGHAKIREILVGYASGASTEELFERHLGKPFATIEAEFDAALALRLKNTIRGWSPSEDRSSKDPRDLLYRDALTALRGGDVAETERILQRLIQRGGDGYTVRMALADLLRQGPSWRSAATHLKQARTFNTEAVEPIIRLSKLARRRGEQTSEKNLLREALAIDAMSFDPAARLLMLATVSGDSKAANLARNRARAIAPLHPITLSAQALAIATGNSKTPTKKTDLARARGLFGRALQATPEQGPSDTLVVMALAAAAVGDNAAAKKLANAALADTELPAAAEKALAKLR